MKKSVFIFLFTILIISSVSASCNLEVTLLNQDPYPAVPGDYVKLVFQVDGLENPDCKQVYVELVEDYPIIFDPNSSNSIQISGGTFVKDYNSHLMAPFKVRVDSEALNGDSPINIKYTANNQGGYLLKEFNLNIEDVRTDFELFVSDYDYSTNEITLEILNIGKSDVEALTLEIPNQEQIEVKGAFRKVIGDLDSNEFTSTDFEAIPKNGEFLVNIFYTDSINTRRSLQKQIEFDSAYFTNRASDSSGFSTSTYILLALIIILIIWHIYKRRKKKKLQPHSN